MVQAGRETHPVDDAPTEHEGKKGGGGNNEKDQIDGRLP